MSLCISSCSLQSSRPRFLLRFLCRLFQFFLASVVFEKCDDHVACHDEVCGYCRSDGGIVRLVSGEEVFEAEIVGGQWQNEHRGAEKQKFGDD